ncbi:MAG TPA: ATP-binding protein [Vicinamibacterales bacterium]|nr:ATP-binding protein [Vicinamibacterales bacterium]
MRDSIDALNMSARRETAVRRARNVSLALGVYPLLGAVISFAGWAADLPRLTDWNGAGISIQPNATIAAMASGIAILLLEYGHRRIAALCGVLVAAIGSTVLYQYISGVDLHIDTLLMFERQWGRGGVLSPGRMGPPGATSWTIIGFAFIIASLFPTTWVRTRSLVPLIASLTAAIAFLPLIGYLYGANVLYSIPTATVIALQTSTFILAVSLGLMLAVPEHGAVRLLTDTGPAGVLIRRILPALIVIPVVLGLVRLAGEQAGWYDLAFGTASRTLAEIALLLVLLWWTASAISRQSRAREHAEAELRESQHQLQMDLADSQLLQRVSAEIIPEGDEQSLYDTIVEAAIAIMQSQHASIQIVDPETRELKLLNARGFTDRAKDLWQSVSLDSSRICGRALATGERVMVSDVEASDFLTGSEDRKVFLGLGVRAVQSTPLYSRTGELLGMISTYWSDPHEPSERAQRLLVIVARQAADLIERRRSADALRDADRRKDEFLMTLAHELRNPLAPIRSAVDLIKRSPQPGVEEVRWARDILDRQAALMTRLLDDLLDVGRIARDKLELRTSRVDVGTLIREAADMNRSLVDEFGHSLTVTVPTEPMYLDADPVRLAQVFSNILNNACRYTPSGGRIDVTAERIGDDAVVRVRDTGIGIPGDRLLNIFDMFSQVDRSLERSQRGLGIGLHLVKRLVEMHGGEATAQSDGLGRGSAITVKLPLATDALHAGASPAPSSLEPTQVPARRILVVDDNVDAAQSLAMLLDVCGHETHMAHDGLDAIEAAEQWRPDVILLDIGLPKMNGFEACRQIRQRPWSKDVVIIALTGWGQDVDRRRSQESGFDHHVVKPVEHAALVKLLGAGNAPGAAS